MWPSLFGPGWVPQLLLTIGMLGGVVAVLKIALVAPARPADEPPDEIQGIWHRYEAGDLTHWEFDRLRRATGRARKAPPRTIAA